MTLLEWLSHNVRAANGHRSMAGHGRAVGGSSDHNPTEEPMDRYAHPTDEPCPPGCPTRHYEIADCLTEYATGLGVPVAYDPEYVRQVLADPLHVHPRGSIPDLILTTARNLP